MWGRYLYNTINLSFSGGRALHPDTILSSMSDRVFWWFIFLFSICDVSILLLFVHRISWYFSCSLLNIDAPQHNSTLAFASHSVSCHSQRLGYPWELGGSTASLQTSPCVSNPAVWHVRQSRECSQYPQIRQTQSSVSSSSKDLSSAHGEWSRLWMQCTVEWGAGGSLPLQDSVSPVCPRRRRCRMVHK